MADGALPDRRQEIEATVAIGSDGFLFPRDNAAFEQFCGGMKLSDQQIERWASLLEARHAWCQARGIHHIIVVIPEKLVIYDDKLPAGVNLSALRPIHQIMDAVHPMVRRDILYPELPLREGRLHEDVFFKLDSHLTPYGGFVAYRALAGMIPEISPRKVIKVDELVCQKYQRVGNLAIRIDSEPHELAMSISHPRARYLQKTFQNHDWGNGYFEIYETGKKRLPRGVLFRDCGAASFLPFLATHFSRLAVLATRSFFHELVRHEQPCVVITQMHESVLVKTSGNSEVDKIALPEDFGPLRFEALTKTKLPVPGAEILLRFGERGNGNAMLKSGWSPPDPDFVRGVNQESVILIPRVLAPVDHWLEMDVIAAMEPSNKVSQRLTIDVNGEPVHAQTIKARVSTVSCVIPAKCLQGGAKLEIRLVHPDGRSPKSAGVNNDMRILSLALARLRIRKCHW